LAIFSGRSATHYWRRARIRCTVCSF